MKRCPSCQRTYPDDAPAFCVNDGTRLVDDASTPPAYDPQKTIMASAPPPPPQQYSNPAQPPYNPASPPPAPVWPPPPQQQDQNWAGGGYYQQPGQYPGYAPAAEKRKGLSLTSFLIGIISFLALVLIFMMAQRVITPDRDVAEICYWGSAGLGLIAVVLGLLALISKRQRSKWMAILGMCLGLPAIIFFIYVMLAYTRF
jgi:hypothetical protein